MTAIVPAYLASAGILASPPALALDCAAATSTVDIVECANQNLAGAHARLNHAYKNAFSRISSSDYDAEIKIKFRKALQEAQRKWIAFRDSECELASFKDYKGTISSIIRIGCLESMTSARVSELNKISED